MAEFTHKDLKIARESRGIKKWELANELGVSEDTIYRWESGKQEPTPDDVGNIEKYLQARGLWHKWMLSHFDSYRERYTDAPEVNHLSAAVASVKFELRDVLALIDEIERDALDGKIDDQGLKDKFIKELQEGDAATIHLLERLRG